MRPLPHLRLGARLLLPLGLVGLVTSCSGDPGVSPPSSAASASPSAASPSAASQSAASPSVSASASPVAPAAAPTAASATPVAPATTMTISSFEYEVPESVRPGEQVTVVNEDREAHTVTVDGGATRVTVPGGGTAVFDAPTDLGEHPVVCDFHGGMQAELVVA